MGFGFTRLRRPRAREFDDLKLAARDEVPVLRVFASEWAVEEEDVACCFDFEAAEAGWRLCAAISVAGTEQDAATSSATQKRVVRRYIPKFLSGPQPASPAS